MVFKQSGQAYEFELDWSLGRAQALLFDVTPKGWLPQLYIVVYSPPIRDRSAETMGNKQLLNPIKVYAIPSTRGKHAWRQLNSLHSETPFVVPESKDLGLVGNNWSVEVNSEQHVWKVNRFDPVRNEISSDFVNCYAQIGHLEQNRLMSQREIVIRASMELIKLGGHSIEEYYDIRDAAIRQVYLESIDIPFLKDIPNYARGRCLSERELYRLGIQRSDSIPFRSKLANPKPVNL